MSTEVRTGCGFGLDNAGANEVHEVADGDVDARRVGARAPETPRDKTCQLVNSVSVPLTHEWPAAVTSARI